MGDEKGKNSGVTADDLSRAPDISKVPVSEPHVVQRTKVGEKYIDDGAVCDGKGLETPGCLFEDAQRARLIADLDKRIGDALSNYKDALLELKVEELMKKEADLHWAASLALDLIGTHLVKVAAHAVMRLKAAGVSQLASHMDGRYASDKSLRTRAEEMLSSMDAKFVEGSVKAVLDPLKKRGAAVAKSEANHENKTEKQATIAFIDQLTNKCDEGFRAFGSHVAGYATDAEIYAVWDGFDPQNHTRAEYKVALGAKLDRFKKSGVNELGRRYAKDRLLRRADVIRDRRVVWLVHGPNSRTLWYQSHESHYNPNVIRRGDPDTFDLFGDEDQHLTFGDRDRDEEIRRDGRVPDEFAEVALARSEAIWGKTIEISDPRPVQTEPRPAPTRNGQRYGANDFLTDSRTGAPDGKSYDVDALSSDTNLRSR